MKQLFEGDCLQFLDTIEHVKCIFADPPDNIGLKYDGYIDKRDDYYAWLTRIIKRSLEKCDIFWLSYHMLHDLEVTSVIKSSIYNAEYRRIIWRYTFGQYRDGDFASGYRNIVMIKRDGACYYPDAIREPSIRMEIGDKRAAGPRVPDDVWDFPRVVGNSIERCPWHPTQHPVVIYNRIMRYSCIATDTFVDLFAGTGTCFRANGGCDVVGCEISPKYCERLRTFLQ